MTLQTIVAIPGPWKTRKAIVQALAKSGFAGESIRLEIQDHDPAMRRAFEVSGGAFDEASLDEIAAHRKTVYLVAPGGDVEVAKRVLRMAAAVLDAGGLAVKVETAGVAYTKERWRQLVRLPHGVYSLWHAFVLRLYDPEKERASTIGMKHLGLPDAVSPRGDVKECLDLVGDFSMHLVAERPMLRSGETFAEEGAPLHRLEHARDDRYEEDDLFWNPFGVWTLSRARKRRAK